jgi:hypothetical protein
MGLLNMLTQQGSQLSQFDGNTPPTDPGVSPQSTKHYQYSINGNPNMTGLPTPSILDLDGVIPPVSSANPGQALPYLNNLPE